MDLLRLARLPLLCQATPEEGGGSPACFRHSSHRRLKQRTHHSPVAVAPGPGTYLRETS